jgi:3-deoxy-D-manno-octulosonic-acid transferase
MYVFYSALLALAIVLAIPYWVLEMVRHGKYRRGLAQRLGVVPEHFRADARRSIWVHAVSVGEVLAVSELVARLRMEFPQHRIVVSTTTDTGQALAASRFGNESVFYFPLDFAFAARAWVRALKPSLVVLAETEFWPNLLRVARQQSAQIAIVNARISDRSLPGYRRSRRVLKRVLESVNLFLAQTKADARRLAEIGAPAHRIFVGGNLKYDIPRPAVREIVEQLRASFANSQAGPVLVCGSTVEGEEGLLIEAFEKVLATFPAAVMVLAPRHPQRFGEVEAVISRGKIGFHRRSRWTGEPLSGALLLVDTIGELSSLYALADIAFVGGSLVPRGGHNIIEPAQHGVPILVGPHIENFREIVGLFKGNDAVRLIEPGDLPSTLLSLLHDDDQRRALGQRAAETLRSQQGATEFAIAKLKGLLAERVAEAMPA